MRRVLPEYKEQRFIQEAETRHAVLHDFCLGLPGGVLLLVAGIAGRISGAGRGAAIVTLGGVAQIFLSFLSLKAWRRRNLGLGGMLTALQAGEGRGCFCDSKVDVRHDGVASMRP